MDVAAVCRRDCGFGAEIFAALDALSKCALDLLGWWFCHSMAVLLLVLERSLNVRNDALEIKVG